MSSIGRLVRVALFGALGSALALSGCVGDDSAELEDRVRELEDENTALREQIAELEATGGSSTTTTAAGDEPPATTDPAEPSRPTSAASSTSGAPGSTTTSSVPAFAGTRENPYALNQEFRAGDWTLQVLAVEANADPAIASLSPDNPPAIPGNVYFRFRMRAVYNGDGGGDAGQIRVNLLSPTGATIGPADVCCDPQRVALADQPETFPGGVVEGWLYYQVVAADLFEGPFLGFQPDADQAGLPGGVVFFALG